jgi:hypothetical protein
MPLYRRRKKQGDEHLKVENLLEKTIDVFYAKNG